MSIYILQALNTKTCSNCLWWQAWWFVTKKLRAMWTLSWNIQTKAIGNFEKDIYFNHLATIYTGLIWFQVTTRDVCSKMTPPFYFKVTDATRFMAVHSRYGCHYVCSTDLWRGQWSEEFTLPHLLQDTGELVHINRGGVVFSYSLSKNWQEPNLESRQQKTCDDLSSERCGIVVPQSVAPSPMACRACWMRGHTISSLQCRPVREPWMTQSSILPLRWIYADPHHYWSASIPINLPNSVFNEAFSEPKTDAFPAIAESNGRAGDSSVKGIMDHYCLIQGTWHGHHTARSQLQSTGVKGNSECMLHSLGQKKFMPPNPNQMWKVLT